MVTPIVVCSISKRRGAEKLSLLSLVAVGLGILLSLSFGSNPGAVQAAASTTAPGYYYFSFEVEVEVKLKAQGATGSPALSQTQVQELANTTTAKWHLEFRADNRAFVGKLLPVTTASSGEATTGKLGVYRLLSRLEQTQKSGQLVLVDEGGTLVGSQELNWNTSGDYSLTGGFTLSVSVSGNGTALGTGTAEFDKTTYQLKNGLHSWASSLVSQLASQEAASTPAPTLATTSRPIATSQALASATPNKSSSSNSSSSTNTGTDEASQSGGATTTTRTVRRGGNPVLLAILTMLFWGLGAVLLSHAFQVGLFGFNFRTSSGAGSGVTAPASPSSTSVSLTKVKEKTREKKPFSFGFGSSQKSPSNPGGMEASAELSGSNGAVIQPETELKQKSYQSQATQVSLLAEMDEIQMPDLALFALTATSINPNQHGSVSGQPPATPTEAEGSGPTLLEVEVARTRSSVEPGQEGGQVGKSGSILAPVWSYQGNDELGSRPGQSDVTPSAFESSEGVVVFIGNLKKLDSQFERDALALLLQDNAASQWLAADKVVIENQVYLKGLAKDLWSTTGSTGFGSAESAFMGNDSRLDFLLKIERAGYPTRLVAIETDGPQHFTDEAQRRRDVKKNRIVGKLNIPLIRVSQVHQLPNRLEALQSVLWEGANAPIHPTIFIGLDKATKAKLLGGKLGRFSFKFSGRRAGKGKNGQQ